MVDGYRPGTIIHQLSSIIHQEGELQTMTPRELIDLATEREAKIIDVRFVDLPGMWQHFSMPATTLDEEMFEDGIGFDGSSIRGFQKINESDMLLIPDPNTAFMDPFTDVAT